MRYGIVLGLPAHWSQTQATQLAERLMEQELPSEIGLTITDLDAMNVSLFNTWPLRVTNDD